MKHYIPASFSQGPVTSLQSMLRAIAFVEQQFPVISATGLFDEDTLEAVLRFQKQNYLASWMKKLGTASHLRLSMPIASFHRFQSRPTLWITAPFIRVNLIPRCTRSKGCSTDCPACWMESQLLLLPEAWTQPQSKICARYSTAPVFRRTGLSTEQLGKPSFVCSVHFFLSSRCAALMLLMGTINKNKNLLALLRPTKK